MCIAIGKPRGFEIPEKTLHNCWTNNDDGAGFAFVDKNKQIQVHKFLKWEYFIEMYNTLEPMYRDYSDFLIHFRITSRGHTSLENAHPFLINKDMALIHNGTITNFPVDTKGRSDTFMLAQMLAMYPKNWEDNEAIRYTLEGFIGYSKLVILHRRKGLLFFNEGKGDWDKELGCWFSNGSYKYEGKKWDFKNNSYHNSTTRHGTSGTNSTGSADRHSEATGCNNKCPVCGVYNSALAIICVYCKADMKHKPKATVDETGTIKAIEHKKDTGNTGQVRYLRCAYCDTYYPEHETKEIREGGFIDRVCASCIKVLTDDGLILDFLEDERTDDTSLVTGV